MRKRTRLFLWPILALFVLMPALALTSDGYGLSWWTVDSGGHTLSSGGAYTLGGTVGQPDAGAMSESSGTYTLSGGFWSGAGLVEYHIYLPLMLRTP